MRKLRLLLKAADARLSGFSANAVLLAALALALLIGVADVFTDVDLLVLYLAPLALSSWYGGRRSGLVVAIYAASSVVVFKVFQTGYAPAIALMSGLIRLLTYGLFAFSVSGARMSRQRSEELTGFVVHDLRTPIASTITGLQTLETMSEGMDELQKEMVGLALVSSQRALTLVNSILDVSKLEAGRMETNPQPVPIGEFVEETLAGVALWAQGDGIALEPRIEVERWTFDRELTGRVLTNLLSNAIKYAPPGSTVTLSASVVHGSLRLAVTDRGKGIPPGEVEKIFEPFHMVKGSLSGTGLGLAFCRLAILAQGGKIWAESTLGKGTTMHVSLPGR